MLEDIKQEAINITKRLESMSLEERIKDPYYQKVICKKVCTQYKFFDMMFPQYHITQSLTGHFNPGGTNIFPMHAS